MSESVASLLPALDHAAALLVWPLAVWILLSGLDDLVVLICFLYHRAATPSAPSRSRLRQLPQRRIAVFIPCWREHRVIGEMVEHNLSAIRYDNYAIFIGAYPNDEPTLEAVRRLEERHRKVHLCLCPHDGPTSKADCLNWIYQRLLLHEEERDLRYDLVLIHDAEDLVHPDELLLINFHARAADMIQVPVLPLATRFTDFTHGLYCDDFAESHTKDLPARQALGGFLPSSGVGTGYTRQALERLAGAESNRVFEPACLTEDYENGLRLYRLGFRQAFVPIAFEHGAPLATREFFPRRFADAVRQRTRWVTGIALQGWERYGWRAGIDQLYWLWRDRKGLIGNPVSFLANLVFLYGVATWVAANLSGAVWGLAAALASPALLGLVSVNLGLMAVHLSVRAVCVSRIYGWKFALGVPLRSLYGNWLNTVATVRALHAYTLARWRREPLVWVKTEHAYPSRAALLPHKRPLEEILVGSHYLAKEELEAARARKPHGMRLGEYLVRTGLLTEDELYEALSLQLGLALGKIDPREVRPSVARCLPAHVIREWNVLPVRIEAGSLHLASPEIPTEELHEALRRFTRLDIRVELVTPTNFRRLAEQLL